MYWEYLIHNVNKQDRGSVTKELNTLGAEGWELVFVIDETGFVFKRKAQPVHKPYRSPIGEP